MLAIPELQRPGSANTKRAAERVIGAWGGDLWRVYDERF